ncbi:alpha/beta-hydrolase [Exidia glandulosa HHB12029]|uniref:Carboxypeptidase n=1 Tax=Exidia glandulosa HHB12029 TaxID=1314781 RepID=A0A165DMK3_EXIGL|nr:alpha/beta-hydrolase [Exidia glandulosa HHB12029]
MDIQREALARLASDFLGPSTPPPSPAAVQKRQSSITFSDPRAAEFFVDGTSLPEVNFDAGPSWSGLIPITDDPNETRKLFFWFWPAANVEHTDELLFWTNGGPGCSSLEGLFQENGPITWSWGQAEPTPNQFSWTNLANVLWVEQPVGTGFSQGQPSISNDDELAEQLVGFLKQFLDIFSELKGKNFFLSGESYAGFYVPYIANFIYEHPDSGLDLNLQGIWIADPSLTYGVVQQEIPAVRFVQANRNVFPFNSTFMAQLEAAADACGYTSYLDDFVTFPPAGMLPLPVGTNGTFNAIASCRLHSQIQRAVNLINPSFNTYRVTDTFPTLWSVLGFPRATQEFIYFNRTDVQDAIHAPHITWDSCSNINVYVDPVTGRGGRDQSIASALSILPNVIEKSQRAVIVHGLADYILIAEGSRIAIQNMTWNGAQGFQTPIEDESFRLKNMGVFGNTHTERGLTYVEFAYSGHMTPQFVPWAAFSTISFLLGRQPDVNTA